MRQGLPGKTYRAKAENIARYTRWWDEERHIWRNGQGRPVARLQAPSGITGDRTMRVVLATAHLDHDPMNNRPRNLAALCQRCHILHDGEEHGAGGGSRIGCGEP